MVQNSQLAPNGVDCEVIGWALAIDRYVKSTQVFQCPSEPEAAGARDNWPDPRYPEQLNYTDYYYNRNLTFGQGLTVPQAQYKPVGKAQMKAPTLTVVLGDGYNGGVAYAWNQPEMALGPDESGSPGGHWDGSTWEASQMVEPAKRHLEGANYVFGDSHVKWLKPEKISGGVNSTYSTSGAKAVSPETPGSYQGTFSFS
jgi:prepilin-type processing-associated H-X9-DG protein